MAAVLWDDFLAGMYTSWNKGKQARIIKILGMTGYSMILTSKLEHYGDEI